MIKTKTIKTDKATLLVVELPEGAYYPNICQLPPNIGVNYFLYENGVNTPYKEPLDIPKGNWQLLGRLPDITEGQSDKVVVKSIHTGLYAHYVNGIPVNTYCYKESSDSLYSLLQANEVCFQNKETNPQKYNEALESEGIINGWEKKRYNELRQNLAKIPTFKQQMKIWQEAQSKVWNRERTYLFIKVD